MPRREFTKATKRLALKRSGGFCEGRGEWYGLPAGQRCNADLGKGVEFDHIDLDANSKDNSLENCAAVCIPCHRYKTAKIDQPKAAKTRRQKDRHNGITAPKGNLKTRGFTKKERAPKAPPSRPAPDLSGGQRAMTDKIPDEIMQGAEKTLDLMLCNCREAGDVRQDSIKDIAKALLARDQRAAEIARAFKSTTPFAGDAIADRILSYDEAQK